MIGEFCCPATYPRKNHWPLEVKRASLGQRLFIGTAGNPGGILHDGMINLFGDFHLFWPGLICRELRRGFYLRISSVVSLCIGGSDGFSIFEGFQFLHHFIVFRYLLVSFFSSDVVDAVIVLL